MGTAHAKGKAKVILNLDDSNIIHHSEVDKQDERIAAGEPDKSAAKILAERKGVVPYLNIEDGCWYGWSQWSVEADQLTCFDLDKLLKEDRGTN